MRVTTSDGSAEFDAQRLLDEVVDSLDQTWTQFDRRLSGLTKIEYLWEPVPGCWWFATQVTAGPRSPTGPIRTPIPRP